MNLLINYANAAFQKSQRLNSRTGISTAGFDDVISFSPGDIAPAFRRRNKHILKHDKGNGYWLWKPYFILKSLEKLKEGDTLFYSDSGAHFTTPVAPLIELLDTGGCDLIAFELQQIEKNFTKRDAFTLMNCDTPEYSDSRQRLAGFSLWRKSEFTMSLGTQYLEYAQDERLITDLENQCGKPNYPEFKHHRHDQSIFSLLTKKHGIKAYRDPSQWGDEYCHLYPDSPYPSIINLTRKHHPSTFRKLTSKFKRKFLRPKRYLR